MNGKTRQSSEKPFPGLNDSGKALLLLEAAHRVSVDVDNTEVKVIPHNRVGPYLYLLDRDGILSTGYDFHWEPLPDSGQLHEDLTTFSNIGYLSIDSKGNYIIANEGRQYLEPYITDGSMQTLETMVEKILEMYVWGINRLMKECYYPEKDKE